MRDISAPTEKKAASDNKSSDESLPPKSQTEEAFHAQTTARQVAYFHQL